jgi:hypothetical protein
MAGTAPSRAGVVLQQPSNCAGPVASLRHPWSGPNKQCWHEDNSASCFADHLLLNAARQLEKILTAVKEVKKVI